LNQTPVGTHCCLVHLEVGEVASGQLGLTVVSGLFSVVKYLKCHFHKISLGGLRATLCLFKFLFFFFQISREDWEIKWELRINIPALEEGLSLV
jgi:hypothetical protein